MSEVPQEPLRPSRLSPPLQIAVGVTLGLSFVTGLLLWWAKLILEKEMYAPTWAGPVRVFHGILNAVIAVQLGYLLQSHIRWGWRLRANLTTGMPLGIGLILLIVSGLGLYYAENRTFYYWVHMAVGLALPAGLGFHWRKGKKRET